MKYLAHIVISITTLFLTACIGPQDPKILDPDFSEQSLQKLEPHRINHVIDQKKVHLHLVNIKDADAHPVVMIHGTPGGWSTFSFVLGNTKLQESNHLISIDRLNWGQSKSIDSEQTFPGFDQQVDAIAQMIRSITDQPVILVGHSLGASLAPSVAIEHPELVKGMILVAGTIDPKFGKPRWYNRLARWKVVQWFLSEELIRSNQEIYALKSGLDQAEPQWQHIDVPVTVIQGLKDKLVDPKNINFAQKKFMEKNHHLDIVTLPKSGHFIPWEHTDVIVKAIQRMTEKSDNNENRSLAKRSKEQTTNN